MANTKKLRQFAIGYAAAAAANALGALAVGAFALGALAVGIRDREIQIRAPGWPIRSIMECRLGATTRTMR